MTNELNLIANKRALVIIAHPDDETIWMGGTIRRRTDVLWTIFSLCRASDADREPKFRRVCAHYGAECLISDLDDEDRLDYEQAKTEAKRLLLMNIGAGEYDYLFTHGLNGEYGHPRHSAIHEAVVELLKEEYLKPEAVFYFDYIKNGRGGGLVPAKNSILVPLTAEELAEKKRIVSDMYGYEADGIDVGYCTNPESFLKI